MNKPLPKIMFQDIPPEHREKVERLKTQIATGEYQPDPQNLAEKLMASGIFFNLYKQSRPRLLKQGPF
jgi:hypothetical protein